MFVDRSVPQITEQWAGMAVVHDMLAIAGGRIQRCVDARIFATGTDAMTAMHLVWGALTGPAVLGSGCRLAPGESPDALARDVLELVISGLKTGSVTTFVPCAPHPQTSLDSSEAGPASRDVAIDGVRTHDA